MVHPKPFFAAGGFVTWFRHLRDLLVGSPQSGMSLCMIVSEQEGAEIWIDGKKTNYVTPKLVAVPKNREVDLTLKLVAHEPHSVKIFSPQNLSYYYCCLDRIPLRLISNEISQTANF